MKIKRGEISVPWGEIYSLAKKREELTGKEFNGGKIIGNQISLKFRAQSQEVIEHLNHSFLRRM